MVLVCQNVALGAERLSKQLGLRIKTIYLDPWYGGKETGPRLSQVKRGKDVTLELAQKMKGLLEAQGYMVYLSRSGDEFVPLEMRGAQARMKQSDIHLIIKISETKKDCISIYTEPRSTKKRTENTTTSNDPSKGLGQILDTLAADSKHEESLTLAGTISKRLNEGDISDCIQLLRSFDYVLLNAAMPAVSVDFGVSPTSKKQPYILDSNYQNSVSNLLSDAIKEYADDRAPKMN